MRKLLFLLLFILTGNCARSQSGRIPQLKEELYQAKEDTAKINLLITIGRIYMFSSKIPDYLDSANIFYDQALKLSIKLNEPNFQYKTLEKMAFRASLAGDYLAARQGYLHVINWYQQTGQFAKEGKMWVELGERYGHFHDSQYLDETISYFQRARSLYLEHNMPAEAASALTDIASRRVDFKQFDQAEKELYQALDEYKAAGHIQLRFTYDVLFRLYNNQGNYYRAAAILMEQINRMKIENDSTDAASYYQQLTECNMAVKKYEEAIGWVSKAIALRGWDTDLTQLLARCLISLNRFDHARAVLDTLISKEAKGADLNQREKNWTFALYYSKLNKNELALQHYIKTLEKITNSYRIEGHYNKWLLACNNGIAETYLKMGQPRMAEKYLNSSTSLIRNLKTSLDPALVADFYGQLYKHDVATGNFAAAVVNLERKIVIQDSLFTADKDKQLAELNIKYETKQKEQSIKDLQNQTLIQQAKTEKANLQRNITIAGILVMIGVSYLFYRNYRQKKAANNIISSKNTQLQHLITEKEWLLKEVHHRVKNNLHTIIGLLQSQATYLQDDALKANQISKHRIYAMSLIHQQLYKTEDIKSTDMAVFLPELLDYLAESFGTEKRVRFSHAISPVRLGISQAIPVALMVNEAVTNAIKYAFPNDRSGTVTVSMQQSPGGRITLTIADDGVGMDPSIIREETNSLGVKLLFGLTGEIDGKIDIANKNGTIIRISFDPDPLNDLEYLSRNN